MTATDGHFKSNNHALAAGMVMSLLASHGITVTPEVTDDSDWTPRMTISLDELDAEIAIEVIPPEGDLL